VNEICVHWKRGDTLSSWSDLCAKIIEQFGLPGGRYSTEVCAEFMSFKFENEKDAFLCKILLSESL